MDEISEVEIINILKRYSDKKTERERERERERKSPAFLFSAGIW